MTRLLTFALIFCFSQVSAQDKPKIVIPKANSTLQATPKPTAQSELLDNDPRFSPFYQNIYVDQVPAKLETVHYVKKDTEYAVRFSGMAGDKYFYKEILFDDLQELLTFMDFLESGKYHAFHMSRSRESIPFYFVMHPKVDMKD